MIMKQQQIVDAYKTILKFEEKELPLKTSYQLFKLKKKLTTQWEFELDKEKEIMEKYHPTYNENRLVFKSAEDQNGYANDMIELLSMEVDDIEKTDIEFGEEFGISIADIEALDEFVNFK